MIWFGAAALLSAAVMLLAFALLRQPARGEGPSRQETTTALYRDRLGELEQDLATGTLAATDRDLVTEELNRSLLDDYAEEERVGGDRIAPGVVLFAALCLIAGSLGVYTLIGDPAAERLRGAERLLQLDAEADRQALLAWQDQLERRVQGRAGDAKSWYLLGHTHLKLGDYQAAAEDFARAHAVHGDDPSIDVYWLQARYLAGGGVIDATSRSIAERLLAQDPNHLLVLEMYAIDAFRSGEVKAAVGYLDRALSRALDAEQRASLRAGMAEARRQLGNLNPSVDVDVMVADPVPRGATLFVIARPVGGGMPFAVVRRPALDFPLSIRLDDAVSMNPAQPLSAADEVEIAVRLSLGGTPLAQPGDWEWQSPPIGLDDLEAPVALEARLAPPT